MDEIELSLELILDDSTDKISKLAVLLAYSSESDVAWSDLVEEIVDNSKVSIDIELVETVLIGTELVETILANV